MTTTNWDLIRTLSSAAIDACEAVERTASDELQRDNVVDVAGQPVSVHDILHSAWTYPESLRRVVIRARHQLGDDLPYTPDLSRILVKVAEVCAELVGVADTARTVEDADPQRPGSETIEGIVSHLADWYIDHMVPTLNLASARACS
jgi:hypothetical protein